MNDEVKRVTAHLEEVYDGDPWYGDNIMKKLASITFDRANWRPYAQAHSVAQILKHMINWKQLVVAKLKNNDPHNIEMNSVEDWDKNLRITSQNEWQELVAQFTSTQRELLRLLSQTRDEDLEQTVSGRAYNMAYLVNGIYEHNIYHLGQIGYIDGLYKKSVGNELS